MPKMIQYGSKLLRINTENNSIEYSTNDGRTWTMSYKSSIGELNCFIVYGKEVIIATSRGIYYSTSPVANGWSSRFLSLSTIGNIIDFQDAGDELLVQTSKGLYYSTDKGKTWKKRN